MDVLKQAAQQPTAVDRPYPSERPPWPKRVRLLFDEVRSHGCAWLQAPLRHTLAEFDQQLFARAERARNHLEQQLYFESRQALQQGSRDFEAAFHAALVEGFQQLGQPLDADAGHDVPTVLALIDPEEQEQGAVLSKLAARGESRNSSVLFELSYRFAALLGTAPLEGRALPLGPQALAHALRQASSGLPGLQTSQRIELLRSFDAGLMSKLEPLYQTINERLIAGGILPQLRAFPHARQERAPSRPETKRPAAAAEPTPPPPSPASRDSAPTPAAPSPAAPHSENIAILENLRELLAQQRLHTSAPSPVSGSSASSEQLQSALQALQHHMADVTGQAAKEIRSAKRLREELLVQLNANRTPGSAPIRLSAEQSDTVDVIAMLFEQLGQEVHSRQQATGVLGRLQLPLLRMAIADHDFFNQREHPARKLLDAVAETADNWLDADGQLDHALAAQLEQLAERANREPPSTALYAGMLAEMEQQLATLLRKSRAAERRQIEAMQGRERLEQARRRAAALIGERAARRPPRGLLRVLLERAWADVLALSLLRHGERSSAVEAQLQVTEQLLGLHPIEQPAQLRSDIESGLLQIGMHHEEAAQVAAKLLGQSEATSPAHPEAPPTAATDLAIRLKQRQRLGESVTTEAAPADEAAAPAALDAAAQAMHERLLQLPFGSWLEFLDAPDGATQRKLAWYSPVSGRCLLVTRRGSRSEEVGLRQLARDMASGRVRELAPDRGGALDRAWNRVVAQLRRFGLRGQGELAVADVGGI